MPSPSAPTDETKRRKVVLVQLAIYVIPMLMVASIPLGMVAYPWVVRLLKSRPAQLSAPATVCVVNGAKTGATEVACLAEGGRMKTVRTVLCPPDFPYPMALAQSPSVGNVLRCFSAQRWGFKVGFTPVDEEGKPRPAGLEGLSAH